MSQHTPGPWRAAAVHDGWAVFAPFPGFNPERTVFQCRAANRADAETAANARLIAAAPDMLEALKTATEWLTHWQRDVAAGLAPTPESLVRLETDLRAAIAKAEGR